jgi:sugar lactone lactonase YvrE
VRPDVVCGSYESDSGGMSVSFWHTPLTTSLCKRIHSIQRLTQTYRQYIGGDDMGGKRRMRTGALGAGVLLVGLVMALAAGAAIGANGNLEVVASFDADKQEQPEGITIDKEGNAYVTMGFPFFWAPGDGEIRRISPDGTETTLASFPGGQGPAGIVVNARGDVYFAWPNPGNPDTNGVYRLHDDGSTERLPGSENIVLANGLAFDNHGNLFVSDSLLGTIWRIPSDGSSPAEPWFSDPSLIGGCDEENAFGANGVAIWKDSIYVATTDRGGLVRISVLKNGSAGTAEVIAGNDCDPGGPLWGLDGIALDVHGDVYAVSVLQNQLLRIDPSDGSVEVLLTGEDGLFNPASIAFGTGKGDRQSVFMTNFALIPDFEPENSLGPAVLKFDVGVPGLPLP